MPQQNLKDSAIFKISIDVAFEAVGMVQTKKGDLLQKLLGEGIQPVLLVEVWDRFAKSSSLRLMFTALWKTTSSSYVWKVVSDAASEKTWENNVRTKTGFLNW